MGQKFLIDTNTIIDFLGNKMPDEAAAFLDNIEPIISVITRIESLGWLGSTSKQLAALTVYINAGIILPLDESVILKTIELRQNYRIKTPDAIIAATALVNDFTLISRNVDDFNKISNLNILNPFTDL